jgi:hypothetical protein
LQHEQDPQEQKDITTGSQVFHKQPTEWFTPSSEPQPNVSHYGHIRKPTKWMQESLEQQNIALQAYYKAMHEDDYLLQDEMINLIASYLMPTRISCTSMRQCKHRMHTNLSRL